MNFKSVMRKTSSIMALIMAFTVMSPIVNIPDTVEAASIRLSKKNVTIKVGQTITLKVKGTKKKVKWSSNKSSVAKVTQKGKVTGKKAGSAKITAKVNNKKLICKITVKSKAKKPVKTNIPVKTKDPLVNVTSMPQNTNVPDESKNPNITQTPIETVKPNNTIVPDTTKIPIKTKNPLINETSTPQNTNAPTTEKPIVTEIPQETIAPNVTEKPEETLAPVETKTPVKLALNFYLEPFNPELPDSQFVEVHFVNHTKEDVYIETDAYMTTKGVNYPAMILYSKEGDLEKVEPVEEDNTDGQLVIYDSKQWVMGNYTPETLWLKSDENSTFTFFFRIGDKRYHATINYDQGGAIFTEASDTDVLQPLVTSTPQETIAPIVTEKPKETLVPVETKTPVKLALNFYLEPFNPELPDSQFVEVHFVNHTKEDVYIETDAYMTTKGVNYPAMILGSKEGDLEKVEPVEENNTYGKRLTYDSKEYVIGNYTPETLWLKSDENSTFTFFFRIGDKRYHATINYDQGGAIFTEASDTDVLQPLVTSTPQETIAPVMTEKPEATIAPAETKTPVKLALNFYLEPFNPELPDSQFVEVHFVNHTKEDVYIETDAYMTTKGVNYPAMILGSKEGDLEKVEPVEENNTYGKRLTYDSKEYVMGNYTHETLWLKSDENSTFTFFFRIGDKRYHATINYDQGGAIFTEASDTEVLEPIMSYTPIKE